MLLEIQTGLSILKIVSNPDEEEISVSKRRMVHRLTSCQFFIIFLFILAPF